jgi:hypothetical protein
MKKTIFIAALLLSGFVFQTANAQVNIGVRANIGTQPVWGPVGYDRVEYYYMPDIDLFYNVPRQQYVYQEDGRWRSNRSLPSQYSNYDFNSGYKVVINDDPRPYRNVQNYRTRYAGYKGNHGQEIIRNSRDSRYFVNRNHPEYNNWRNNNGNRGRGNGNGNRNGRNRNNNY